MSEPLPEAVDQMSVIASLHLDGPIGNGKKGFETTWLDDKTLVLTPKADTKLNTVYTFSAYNVSLKNGEAFAETLSHTFATPALDLSAMILLAQRSADVKVGTQAVENSGYTFS